MNCGEFESDLPEFLEGVHTSEQQAHLDSCPACSGLLSDLNLISSQAKSLLAVDEPQPAVWNVLELRLRSEGLIRDSEPLANPVTLKESFFHRWRAAWLVPVAAALAVVAGLKLYHPAGAGDNAPVAKQRPVVTEPAVREASAKAAVSSEDQQWLNSVAARPPAVQAGFRADLDNANSFIRDAEASLRDDPNDAYTQQMLINAYEQKQMLYELAVDRSSQ
jgi:hypothetical protein